VSKDDKIKLWTSTVELEDKPDKGWTVTFVSSDDGELRVAGRFNTTREKETFLDEITKPGSGWTEDEIVSINCINDKMYMLPF